MVCVALRFPNKKSFPVPGTHHPRGSFFLTRVRLFLATSFLRRTRDIFSRVRCSPRPVENLSAYGARCQ